MIISDEEASDLKAWVVKKLENISDAESDILADYVLALIRADNAEPELRANVIENLEDFLKDNTVSFVDDVLLAIKSKSFLPDQPTFPSFDIQMANAQVAQALSQPVAPGGYNGGLQQSRKRSYNDRQDDRSNGDSRYAQGGRQMKTMRRGGRGDSMNGSYGRHTAGSQPGVPQTSGFPPMPNMPAGLPFDPNDPMGAIIAMQAMGFPPMPGMPEMPATGFPQTGSQGQSAQQGRGKNKINARCRDYDSKGFCTRGNACPFEHGQDHFVVPGQQDEYDPKKSNMVDVQRTPTSPNGRSFLESTRGQTSTRGRGRGRGGFESQKRNRAEFSHAGPNHDRSITSIVVEQIPEEKFDESSVREFFSDFGSIAEVTMQAYKRLALVKYDDYFSAKKAYESPKVIFDNRFVKVYWYKPDSLATSTTNGSSVKSTSPTASKPEEQPFDKEKFERDAMAAQKKLEDKKALQRDTELKRQELERQKEELARKQAEEKRRLMEKLKAKGEAMDVASPALETKENGMGNASKRSTDSAHTEALRAQVAALEEEAKSLGIDPTLTDESYNARGRGRGRGRGSYRGWEGFAGRGRGFDPARASYRGGRGTFRGARGGGGGYNLDNRPKKVKVSGVAFDSEKDEGLKQYLLGIGEFESIEPSSSDSTQNDAQTITFKDRFTAEKFMYGTKDIPSVGKVEFTWVNTPLPPVDVSKFTGAKDGDGDVGMGDAGREGDHVADREPHGEIDYDVAEEDERWMA